MAPARSHPQRSVLPLFCWINGIYRSRFGAQNLKIEAALDYVIIIAVAYGALLFYDGPARRWLTTVLEAQ